MRNVFDFRPIYPKEDGYLAISLEPEAQGYRGKALKVLKGAEVKIGDLIRIIRNGEMYEGILIPRSIYGDDKHVVIKIKSGYNIGVQVTPTIKIEKIGEGAKPAFTPPPPPKQKLNLPKVVIVSTGGTIASRVDYRTGAVRPALSAGDLYSVVPELSDFAVIDARVLFSLYSENITPKHWGEMAQQISSYVEGDYTGVVVAHGTDTMGYSAAALSFALQNLPIPVIFVGSQRSADRPSSDAAVNLIGAVRAAAYGPFAEVALAMHETVSDTTVILHRGTKVRKCHASRRDAFKSINSPPLARVEGDKVIMLIEDYVKRNHSRKLILKPNFDEKVALIKFYPGMSSDLIDWYIDNDYHGIVLEGTGLGHIGNYCFNSIRRAVKSGVLVAMTSQCIWGRVNMNVYDQGRDLLAIGVIPLKDILPETALVKMMWVFGQTKDLEGAKQLLMANLAHEFSIKSFYG